MKGFHNRLVAAIAALLLVAACGERQAQADSAAEGAATAGTPVAASSSDVAQAAASLDGKALFRERCGMCHQTIGMAVGILSRRPGDASQGFLEERSDLSAQFVQTVVRAGILNMPRMPRAEVSDPELASIASYLSRGKP